MALLYPPAGAPRSHRICSTSTRSEYVLSLQLRGDLSCVWFSYQGKKTTQRQLTFESWCPLSINIGSLCSWIVITLLLIRFTKSYYRETEKLYGFSLNPTSITWLLTGLASGVWSLDRKDQIIASFYMKSVSILYLAERNTACHTSLGCQIQNTYTSRKKCFSFLGQLLLSKDSGICL